MTRRELLAKMDSREFSEWQCYFEVLDEKMKESEKEREQKKQKDEETKKQGEVTNAMLNAATYKKVNK